MPLFGRFTGASFFRPGAKPIVLGGVLSEDATYWYRTFFGNGTLTVTGAALSADILVVAGGGGAGADGNGAGGGGGAGGLLGFVGQGLAPTSYTITVGAGGTGGTTANTSNPGTQGSNSSVTGLTAAVGGGAGSGRSNAGNGGSGGGTGDGTNSVAWTPGTGVAGQGYAGSSASTVSTTSYGAGAGGGAGGAATAASGNVGGNGGVGSAAYSSWGLATGTGHNVTGTVYYAGGGGGATYTTATNGSGGNGGGGRGGYHGTAPLAGTANTGGGGGGAGNQSGSISGAAGGSGIVIVRYPKAAVDNTTGADSYELIGTITLAAAQSSVTFAGIPSSLYKHLQLRMTYRGGANLSGDNPQISFNGDTTYTNYYTHWLYGNGTSATTFATSSTNYRGIAIAQNMPDAGSAANIYGVVIVDILDAFSSTKYKTTRSLFGGTAYNMAGLGSGLWSSMSAITSLTIQAYPGNSSNSIAANSRFSLYGVRG